MAMDGNALGDKIKEYVRAALGSMFTDIPDDHELSGYDEDSIQNLIYRAQGRAIVDYLQASATVTGSAGSWPIVDGRVT